VNALKLNGMNVVVMGLGASGRAAAELARDRGATVLGLDLRQNVAPIDGVEFVLGNHPKDRVIGADLVIVSPGVPAQQVDLVAARAAGVPTVGELGFAAAFLTCPIIGVTGTNGKSTVTAFTGALLRAAGRQTFVGGNLGTPLSSAVGQTLDIAVVEVSSYQMELPGAFTPNVAAILNLTPDHLKRHGTMENYAAAKCELLARMSADSVALIPAGDALLERVTKGVFRGTTLALGAHPGVVRNGSQVQVCLPSIEVELNLKGFSVPGDHNRDNAATAATLALASGVSAAEIQDALPRLKALAHRMEVVTERDGVVWINDSKATNVDAAKTGIMGLERTAVVLLGGEAKGPGFGALAEALQRHRAVLTFGGSGVQIAGELEASGIQCRRVPSMEDAIELASSLAQKGDAVLLSPGCASFDAYDNFEHRGRVFRQVVQQGAL